MKPTRFILIFAICLGLFIALPAFAQEQVDSFDAKIQINADATINVTETIKYNFGEEQRHGIYRDIPIKYNRNGNDFNLRISDISIKDETGADYNYETSYSGDNIELKIGDADILISGLKIYVINYKINRAINYFSDHDELYWNVTGNDWEVPILKSSAVIFLPQKVSVSQLQATCYQGVYGDTANCLKNSYVLDAKDKTNATGVKFEQGALDAYQGLTVVLGWPVGLVHKPTSQENLQYFIEDNKGIFLFIFILIACIIFWYFKGKDPAGRGTIIAEYEAPEGLSPAEVGTIIDEKTDKKDISAEIIQLAVKGCLKIKREVEGKLFKHPEYTLTKLKDLPDSAPSHEKKLLAALFGDSTDVKLDDLHEDFYKDYQEITKMVYDLTATNGYFPQNPSKMRNGFMIVGLVVTFILYMVLGALETTAGMISLTVSLLIVIIASRFMSRRTEKGVLAKEQILGLKLFLTVAEKDRLKFHNAPEKNSALFEKLLPYAIALGVETQWAGQFADIYKQPPNWYSTDENMSTFNSLVLIHNMQNFSAQASTVLYTPPASASSGSSGFSGGGSGGGFGGGGGGSW
jgi:uncharacterized membrane protein